MHFAGPVTTMSSPLVNFTCWAVWDTLVKFEFVLLAPVLVPVCFIVLLLDSISEIVVWCTKGN